jgi:hypothetical protein
VARRVEEIVRIVLDGAEEGWDICEYVREKEQEAGSVWALTPGGKPLSASQIRRYVAKADKLIAESCRASKKRQLRRHLARRRNLYAKAVSAGDYRTALAVARDEAELQGLYDLEIRRIIGRMQREVKELREKLSAATTGAAAPGTRSTVVSCPTDSPATPDL